MSTRIATAEDRDLFSRLWTEYTIEHHKAGSDVMPTARTLRYFVGLFDAFLGGTAMGVVVFGGDDNAVLMWGAPGANGLPYDSAFGYVAQGFGTYVRASHRGKGISKKLRQRAVKLLKKRGFDSVMGSSAEGNQIGFETGTHFGFEVIQTTGILRL